MNSIHEQVPLESEFSWLEVVLSVGAIGLGLINYFLARTVWKTSKINAERDRAVHLADKQQDWLIEFRHNIAELMSLQLALVTNKIEHDENGEFAVKEFQRKRHEYLLKMGHLENKVLFMFDTNDDYYDTIKVNIDACSMYAGDKMKGGLIGLAKQQVELRKLIDVIINRQRNNISRLETNTVLI